MYKFLQTGLGDSWESLPPAVYIPRKPTSRYFVERTTQGEKVETTSGGGGGRLKRDCAHRLEAPKTHSEEAAMVRKAKRMSMMEGV